MKKPFIAALLLGFLFSACEKTSIPCDQELVFCAFVDAGNFDKISPLVDQFLAQQNGSSDEQLQALEEWLDCKSCVSNANILCNSCVKTLPPMSELEVVFNSNGTNTKMTMDIRMGEPLTFVGFHED